MPRLLVRGKLWTPPRTLHGMSWPAPLSTPRCAPAPAATQTTCAGWAGTAPFSLVVGLSRSPQPAGRHRGSGASALRAPAPRPRLVLVRPAWAVSWPRRCRLQAPRARCTVCQCEAQATSPRIPSCAARRSSKMWCSPPRRSSLCDPEQAGRTRLPTRPWASTFGGCLVAPGNASWGETTPAPSSLRACRKGLQRTPSTTAGPVRKPGGGEPHAPALQLC